MVVVFELVVVTSIYLERGKEVEQEGPRNIILVLAMTTFVDISWQ